MRKGLLILALFVVVNCFSQNKQVLYNMTSVPQSLIMNPGADFKYKYYFGVPLLSGMSFKVGTTGFSAYDLFANNGVDFNQKLRNVVHSTNRRDHVAINEQIEIFNGGFKLGDWLEDKGYVSFGMYHEFDLFGYVPKDVAVLALEGNQNYIGKNFNLSDLNGKAEMLSVLHLGYHKNISEKLVVGARGKIYFSGFNATSTKNSGSIITTVNQDNTTVYNQEINSNLSANTSGVSKYLADDYDGDVATDIQKQVLFGGNLGLGFDLGFTYYPKKNTQITASILDVGFIRHTKDIENYTYKGYYKYEGINPNFTDFDNPDGVYSDFQESVKLDTLYNKYTTWRPVKLNASYQYSYGTPSDDDCVCISGEEHYKNAVGAQLFVMSTPRAPITALTGFYQRNVSDNLHLKATYTLDSYSYTNIGLGLSANLGKFNMYFMADNLLEYRDVSKANSLSLQFGFNFIFADSNEPPR
ncbi:DUF5723 family protein [Flavobacterium seoulense]|uniref:DUF5723 domain-containing protein n=1 Tax=Flavobacterium seoulense TaxID=1492738 RepID=A0A066WZQ4_9FLAO|nr:DUF5723 family protein [Flavobacterium seoulense]KDN56155.1 hypothetical protein FEM21_07070 [Flavobacterium seoulense]